MRALIIGITSCSGSHLAEYLLEKGYEVSGTKRETSSLENTEHISDKIEIYNINSDDEKSIIKILEQSNPNQIYYLVAASQFNDTKTIYKTNVDGTLNFFESFVKSSCRARIITISSSAVYGVYKDIHPLNEKDELLPSGHYGLSKIFQEKIADYYCRNYSLDVITARPFNFTGPRENPSYVCTDFARQIVDIENGEKEPIIKVGNLENKRDFTDVRDIIKGYELLTEKGIKGETYNLCSGKTFSIQAVLNQLLSMSSVDIKIQVDPKRIRSGETNVQLGDNSKIFSLTGWKQEIPLDKTLKDILEYNRKR